MFGIRRFSPTRLVRSAQRAASSVARRAPNVARQTRSFFQQQATQVARHSTTQRLGRALGAGQRALGHAGALHGFGRGVRQAGGHGATAARDIRQAVRTRSLEDAGRAVRSTRTFLGSARNVAAQAPAARAAVRAGWRTFGHVAPRTHQRLSSAASHAVERTGLDRGASALRRTAQRVVRHPTTARLQQQVNVGRRLLGHARTVTGFGVGAYSLAGQGRTAVSDIRGALRTRSVEDVDKAIGSTRDFVNSARDVVTGAAGARRSARVLGRVASRTAPRVSARLADAAARVARHSGTRALGRVAQHVGAPAILRAGTRVGGRAAARFVPGANIAMAGLDTAAFVNTLRDRNASTGKKVLAGVRAVGSIAAATNIPVVSQAGAALSTVADIASSIKLPKLKLW